METINKILNFIESVGTASSFEIIIKIILMLLAGGGVIWYAIWKAKARKRTAEDQAGRDRSDNVRDNEGDEDQNSRDGRSVRDRLKK